MSNILHGTKTYLIGNLEKEDSSFTLAWRSKFINETKPMGIVCMSPLDHVFVNFPTERADNREYLINLREQGDLQSVHVAMKNIRRKDLAMVDHSTFVVGVLNTTIPGYGTIEELAVTQRANKPLFLVVHPSIKKVPLWIAGMFPPSCFYSSIDDVLVDLKKIDSGNVILNPKYWRIFDKQYINT